MQSEFAESRPYARSKREQFPGPDICLFCLNFPPEPTGIAPYTGALAVGLTAVGYRVTAHSAYPHYPQWARYPGYGGWKKSERVNNVWVERRLHYVPRPPNGIRRLISELTFGMRLVFTNWDSPRIVIALSPPLFSTAAVAVRLRLTRRRPRLIVWVQDIYSLGLAETGEGGEFVQRITRMIERLTLGAADRIVVIHSQFGRFLTEELGIPESKIVTLRNWTHISPSAAIDSVSARADLGWNFDGTLAVHTGNMGIKQGLDNVVDAARIADATNAPVHFVLVGDGSEKRKLEDYARGISRLTFVDPLDDEKYALALRAADVLLVNEKPGVSAMAMPSKLTAYFDAQRPIVAATDCGGIAASEIRAADAGLIVSAGNPIALLGAVLTLRADPAAAMRYGANGRHHREAVLDQDVAIDQWRHLISELIAQES